MLDLHSGSEYGAARIAAMIAAAVTIVLTVLAAFGSMVPYAQADSFGALTINAVWGRDTAAPKSLAGDTYAMMVASPHIKPSAIFPASLPIGNA